MRDWTGGIRVSSLDTIEEFRGSRLQLGNFNNRIYLMNLSPSSSTRFPGELIDLARDKGYSKIFAKVPEQKAGDFFNYGYIKEAWVKRFFSGMESAFFMCFYLDESRKVEPDLETVDSYLEMAVEKGRESSKNQKELDDRFTLRKCNTDDAKAMASIYSRVFVSYPFPVHDPDYIIETMESHVDYFGIEADGRLISLSSSEIDYENANAEMTDFATLPDWRGNSLSLHLLRHMEKEMASQKLATLYTIARAMSPGMNITFSRAGYAHGGRLVNNTNISGKIESMNVWYRSTGVSAVSEDRV